MSGTCLDFWYHKSLQCQWCFFFLKTSTVFIEHILSACYIYISILHLFIRGKWGLTWEPGVSCENQVSSFAPNAPVIQDKNIFKLTHHHKCAATDTNQDLFRLFRLGIIPKTPRRYKIIQILALSQIQVAFPHWHEQDTLLQSNSASLSRFVSLHLPWKFYTAVRKYSPHEVFHILSSDNYL